MTRTPAAGANYDIKAAQIQNNKYANTKIGNVNTEQQRCKYRNRQREYRTTKAARIQSNEGANTKIFVNIKCLTHTETNQGIEADY